MSKKFLMLSDSSIEPSAKKGTEVYKCSRPDYGCASDDTRHTGIPHISLTLDPAGDYPSFTHPFSQIEEVKP